MANSLDQIFRNFINRITGGDTEENVAETKPDQGGLMAPRAVRPRARPEDVEPIGGVATGAASTGNIALKRFVDGLNEATKLDVSLRPKARPLQNTLIDPNLSADTLQQKHNMPLYKFQQENSVASDDGSTVKVFSAPTSDAAVDEIVMRAESLFEKITKPRARPKSIEEIQAIRASQKYTDLDTTRGLQAALNNAGITVDGKPLEEDGIMGKLTKKAIRTFQKDKGLKVDGIAGPITKQALYSVAPKPEITEEVLPSVPLSEGLKKRPGIKTLDPLKGTVKDIEDFSQERVDFIENQSNLEETDVVKAGIFSAPKLGIFTSTPAKLLIRNIFGLDRNQYLGLKPITIDETYFKEDELNHFKNMWNKYGEGLVTKSQQIDSQKDILQVKTGKDGSIIDLPADLRAYYSVGDTFLTQRDNGDVILKDIYDYNIYTDYSAKPNKKGEYPVLTTEQFEDKFSTAGALASTAAAYTSGKIGFMSAMHNMGFLFGSRDYKDSSKDEGTPILINLGNPDTWT